MIEYVNQNEYNMPESKIYSTLSFDKNGSMPNELLMSKFEETDLAPSDDYYESYARGLLTDYRPDDNKFEHEKPRSNVNQSAGKLQLQYYGHRGNADDPNHPEMYLGFDDPDPRGINVDPDFKQLVKQERA